MTCPRSRLIPAVAFVALTLTGCGGFFTPPVTTTITTATPVTTPTPTPTPAVVLKGSLLSGTQTVAGATIQLYQAGTTGYGSVATPLGAAVTTSATGGFTLPSYTCAAGSQVYLVATGGQPIAATSTVPAVSNSNLAEMVGLGLCGGAALGNSITVNELTTVATVWALAPFMTGIANVGSSPTNIAGLANAFAAVNQLVNTATGALSGPALPAGATLPTAQINTLADILQSCTSSGGTASSTSSCISLFNLTKNAAATLTPVDTITAALYIAQNPARNLAALNQLRSASPAFTPALAATAPPGSWTLAITYTGGGLSAPSALATDAAGNLWIANAGNASVTKLDPAGTALSGSAGFTAGGFSKPSALAIDLSGNAWIANAGNNSLTQLNPAGNLGTVFTGNGLTSPSSLAVDGSGNIFVTNASSISAFNSSGIPLAGSPYTGSGLGAPIAVAITPK